MEKIYFIPIYKSLACKQCKSYFFMQLLRTPGVQRQEGGHQILTIQKKKNYHRTSWVLFKRKVCQRMGKDKEGEGWKGAEES